jgi:hypothetical protein
VSTHLLAEIRRLRKAIYSLPYELQGRYKCDATWEMYRQLVKRTSVLISNGPCGQCGEPVGDKGGYGSVTGPVHIECAMGASGYIAWKQEQESDGSLTPGRARPAVHPGEEGCGKLPEDA